MTKMKKIFIALVIFSVLPSVCLADFDIYKWKHYKNIEGEANGLMRLTIDDELFAGTEKDLRDLRIIDDSGAEVPYKMIISKAKSETKTYYPKMLNNSYSEGQYSMVILDFSDTNSEINKLTINTSSKNFQRNVKVYGGNDNSNWNILEDNAYIYNYTDERGGFNSSDTTINFPASIFRYIKIEIIDDGSGDIAINSVTAAKTESQKTKEWQKNVNFSASENDKEKTTEILIDQGFGGVPVNKILLSATDKNFNRSASVYSSFDNKNWRSLGSSYVFRYDTPKFKGENLYLSFDETEDRYLKIVIRNKDNKPLSIGGVAGFSVYREVIFEAEQNKAYKIYYGNDKAKFSEYDFETYLKYYDLNAAHDAVLSAQANNEKYVKPAAPAVYDPKSEKIPHLMSAGLTLASLLLLFLIYKFFQKH